MFLTAPLSDDAAAFRLGLCETRQRDGKRGTRSEGVAPLATPPSSPLPLSEGLEKRLGLRNGGFHGAYQGGNLRFHRHPLLSYGGNRPGI
jgi:hypothetical protein